MKFLGVDNPTGSKMQFSGADDPTGNSPEVDKLDAGTPGADI